MYKTFIQNTLNALFEGNASGHLRWLTRLWLLALYLCGGLAWGKFFNWGSIPFDFHDWAEVWAPRIAVVRDGILRGMFPLHMSDTTALRGVTDRFLALPDIMISPQMLLMAFMDVGPFILTNTLILYTIGMLGLLWLRGRFSLSPAAFTALFLLFNFNGHILSHLSIGHASWMGYFLLPLFVVLVLQLLDGNHSWAWVAKMSLLLFAIFLQGAFHPFVWCLMLLGLLAICAWRHFLPLLKASVCASLLSMVRILPVIPDMAAFDKDYLGGYTSLYDLWKALVELVEPAHALDGRSMLNMLGWWELDLYVGLLGAVFLLYFGLYRWLSREAGAPRYAGLFLPLAALGLLSIGRVYGLLRLVPFPLLAGERVSSRIIILPAVFLMVFAAGELQQVLNRHARWLPAQLGWLGLLLLLAHDLWQHLKLWQVNNAFNAFPWTPRDLTIVRVANHADPPYFMMLGIGAALSLLTLLFLGLMTWRERKKG